MQLWRSQTKLWDVEFERSLYKVFRRNCSIYANPCKLVVLLHLLCDYHYQSSYLLLCFLERCSLKPSWLWKKCYFCVKLILIKLHPRWYCINSYSQNLHYKTFLQQFPGRLYLCILLIKQKPRRDCIRSWYNIQISIIFGIKPWSCWSMGMSLE